MKHCTKCKSYKPLGRFASKKWTNKDGSVTYSKRSHCRECINQDNLIRYHERSKTKEAHKTASYRYRIKQYGLSIEEYEKLYNDQDGNCAICKKKPKEQLNIDHSHKTGKVRALLCRNCNTVLGHSKENIDTLKAIIEYIEAHNE